MPVTIFGLELADVVVVLVLFLVMFNLSDRIVINLVVLIGFAGGLRWAKKDKPRGYLVDLSAFVLSPRHRHVNLADSLKAYPAAASLKGARA
jgi:hypothetical protein